jgi:hypothetical protein
METGALMTKKKSSKRIKLDLGVLTWLGFRLQDDRAIIGAEDAQPEQVIRKTVRGGYQLTYFPDKKLMEINYTLHLRDFETVYQYEQLHEVLTGEKYKYEQP